MAKRASGILLHITSLPSAFGIGDLGPESYGFVDMLAENSQRFWSILPLSPIRLEDGSSPYQTSSVFAGNPLLISPDILIRDGFLPVGYRAATSKVSSKVDFPIVYAQKTRILNEAYNNFKKTRKKESAFLNFCAQNKSWLDDYALYVALRRATDKPWFLWHDLLRKRNPKAILKKVKSLKNEIQQEQFAQYLFFAQWQSLKEYCKAKQVSILGDMPFYVAYDSVDVWVHPDLFNLTVDGKPQFVGGVPPDYFSKTGQLWGNPTYNWQKHQQTGFQWWIDRISHNFKMYDKLRLDHFRGFIAYWQVPANAKTAKYGKWVRTPSAAFFRKIKSVFPFLPFIAEDLGDIDQPVRTALKHLGIPGMRVLVFAFDGAKGNPHLPKNHVANAVTYTGTHDTNTAKGWFTNEATAKERQNLFRVVSKRVSVQNVSIEIVKLALGSVADLSVLPLQDVLGLGSNARMNNPRQISGNWEWRVTKKQLLNKKITLIKSLTERYKRLS